MLEILILPDDTVRLHRQRTLKYQTRRCHRHMVAHKQIPRKIRILTLTIAYLLQTIEHGLPRMRVVRPQRLSEEPEDVRRAGRVRTDDIADRLVEEIEEVVRIDESVVDHRLNLERHGPLERAEPLLDVVQALAFGCVEVHAVRLDADDGGVREASGAAQVAELLEVALVMENNAQLVGVRGDDLVGWVDTVHALTILPVVLPVMAGQQAVSAFQLEDWRSV